jgi:hypothetical protein
MRLPFLPALLAAALLTAGCETVVDVPLPDHDSQLVVNDLFTTDSLWRVSVTRSRGIKEARGGFPPVTNATVELLEGDRVIDTLALDERAGSKPFYRSTDRERPQPATEYTLRVSAPGFETAEATGRAPAPVPFGVSRDGMPGPGPQFELVITDTEGRGNYYALFLYEKIFVDGQFIGTRQLTFRSSSPLLKENVQENLDERTTETYRSALFSDATFRGETRAVSFQLHRFGDYSSTEESRPFVVLASLSEASYEYQRTAALADDTQENPFAEPVQVHSNVRGGLGIFAGATYVERSLTRTGPF